MSGTAQSAGLKGAGTFQIFTGRGVISAVHVISDGTNLATVILYDNALGDTSGNVLASCEDCSEDSLPRETYRGILFKFHAL